MYNESLYINLGLIKYHFVTYLSKFRQIYLNILIILGKRLKKPKIT